MPIGTMLLQGCAVVARMGWVVIGSGPMVLCPGVFKYHFGPWCDSYYIGAKAILIYVDYCGIFPFGFVSGGAYWQCMKGQNSQNNEECLVRLHVVWCRGRDSVTSRLGSSAKSLATPARGFASAKHRSAFLVSDITP